ncbi:hypothetical protein [Chlamydia vaughanii]|uniref:hypothetical protein n=1 Tax=Chlamydia vaughanii TaxID=3112552 RepID=UPI0032B141EE
MNLQVPGNTPPTTLQKPIKESFPIQTMKICAAISAIVATIFVCLGALALVGSASAYFLAIGITLGLFAATLLTIAIKESCARRKPEVKIEEKKPRVPEPKKDIPPTEKLRVYVDPKPPVEVDPTLPPEPTPESGLLQTHRFSLEQMQRLEFFLGTDPRGRIYYPDNKELMEKFLQLAEQAIEAAAMTSSLGLAELKCWLEGQEDVDSYAFIVFPSVDCKRACYDLYQRYCFMRFLHENCSEDLDEDTRKHAEAQFYTPGTPQNRFRSIYNGFCRSVREQLGDPQQEDSCYPNCEMYFLEDLNSDFENPNK